MRARAQGRRHARPFRLRCLNYGYIIYTNCNLYYYYYYFRDAGLAGLIAGRLNPTASLVTGLDAGRLNPSPPLVPGLDAGRLNPTELSLVTGLDAGRLNPFPSLVAGLDGERLDPLPCLGGDRDASLVAGLDAARLTSPSSHPVRTRTRVNSAIRERGRAVRHGAPCGCPCCCPYCCPCCCPSSRARRHG